ncbi:hypothetical protein ACNKHO_05930 [Shigella flexneri]
MTLEAIHVTQSDRDLFKHLISEATDYVAADYMRHADERRVQVVKPRRIAVSCLRRVSNGGRRSNTWNGARAAQHNGAKGDLEADYQATAIT